VRETGLSGVSQPLQNGSTGGGDIADCPVAQSATGLRSLTALSRASVGHRQQSAREADDRWRI